MDFIHNRLGNDFLTGDLDSARRKYHPEAREVPQCGVYTHKTQRDACGAYCVVGIMFHASLAPDALLELFVQRLVGDPFRDPVDHEGVNGVVFEHFEGSNPDHFAKMPIISASNTFEYSKISVPVGIQKTAYNTVAIHNI